MTSDRTPTSDDVLRRVGRNLVIFQQIEHFLKLLLANHKNDGMPANCAAKGNDLHLRSAIGSAATQQRPVCKHGLVLFFLSVLVCAPGSSALGAEARRCLRDGQVIITNAPCELLGNATELNPAPERHFKRGEIEPRSVVPTSPVKAEPAKSLSPPPVPRQVPDSPFRQLLSTLVINLLLPLMLITAVVAWFRRRTRLAAKHTRREPFTVMNADVPRTHGMPKSRPAHSNVEPSIPGIQHAAGEAPKPTVWSLELIRDLEWKRFEDVCQQYYQRKGIRSETTPLGPDGGIDIRLYQDDSGKATAIVQCKAWGERMVGVSLIRELLGVMTHEKIGKAFFMTSGRYSDDAKTIAEANRITLIDGTMLLEMFRRLSPTDQEGLLAFATEGDYRTPTCPSCGIKMVPKKGKVGKPDFWGCPTYPQCHQTLGMRKSR